MQSGSISQHQRQSSAGSYKVEPLKDTAGRLCRLTIIIWGGERRKLRALRQPGGLLTQAVCSEERSQLQW